jgi:hypothetical protein
MKVKCINNAGMERRLTAGKVYEVLGVGHAVYEVMGDWQGEVIRPYKHRFEVVEEVSPITLKSPQVATVTDISDWRTWQHKAPGECVCGIPRTQCDYHR